MSKTIESIRKKRGLIKPSFLEGMARVLDIGGVLSPKYKYSNHPKKDDYDALRSDWEMVGHDMELAIKNYESNHE